tara:strand:+ start:1894 stop:3270 length:1377 start_codon:yes stop_codon:yes gene_type:complete
MNRILNTKFVEALIVTVITGNFIYNLSTNNFKLSYFDINSLIFSIFIFFFLFFIGSAINNMLGLNSISLSIILYLISFFAFQFFFLFYQDNVLNFNSSFIIVNLIWLISIIISKNKIAILNSVYTIVIFIFIYFVRDFFSKDLIKNISKNGDVDYFWFPMTKMIYENNLYYALLNNIEPGYGLLINNTFAVLTKLVSNSGSFIYLPSIVNVFAFIFILFVLEQKLKNVSKVITITLFASIVFNSSWLSYLFINSLMGEAVINLFFPIALISLSNNDFKNKKIKYFSYFLIGFLYLSKPFVSILILIFIAFIALKKRDLASIFFGFTAFVLNFINYKFVINIENSNNYFSISEFYVLGNIETIGFENILKILQNIFYLDRVMILFLTLMIFLIISSLYITKKIPNIEYLFILTINIFLVFILYITIWQDRELESAYRYIFSFFNLYLIYFAILRDKLNS